MKNSTLLLLQSIVLIIVLTSLINGLIRLPGIVTGHIIIRAICTGIVLVNFSYTLYSYLNGK
jgi:hypothetical protein